MSLSKCCSERPALPSDGRQVAQEPALSSMCRAPAQPVNGFTCRSFFPAAKRFFSLRMTEGASQCLWDKCLHVATSAGKEISLLALRRLRRGCGALVQDIFFLNSSRESRLLGEVSITSDTQMTDDITLMAENEEELKSLLLKVKEESEKAGLKLNIQKTKIMASGPITSWQIHG